MEPRTKTSITDITSDGTISVLTQTYVEYDGQEKILKNHREGLAPGQFERAKEILAENQYKAISELWTPDVVEAWRQKLSSM